MQGRELSRRRLRMLTLKSQGAKLGTIINDFTEEYEVSKQALYKDWNKREQWASDVCELDEPALLTELVHGLRQVIPNAWYEYKTNPNPSVKLGALKLAKETYLDILEVLQSVGRIEKVADKVQAEIKAAIIVKMWKPSDESAE